MLNAVTSALSTVISWVGTVITALTSENGALADLLPLFAITVSISALLLGKLCAEGKTLKVGGTLNYETIPSQAA